ncbi:MAG: DmsC/YnfH family molybdoenzyme membrane anchor subunit, partial [Alphaproteobacteria bacterium]
MHPAFSVIVFTTASGAGYGLLALTGLVFAAGGFASMHWGFGFCAIGLGTALVAGGLVSSTLHLGRPERALRALTQVRTSWLSREGARAAHPVRPHRGVIIGRVAQGLVVRPVPRAARAPACRDAAWRRRGRRRRARCRARSRRSR